MVEKMNEKQGDRIRFFLSKADTAGHESDRQVCQTDAMMHALSKKYMEAILCFEIDFTEELLLNCFAKKHGKSVQYGFYFIEISFLVDSPPGVIKKGFLLTISTRFQVESCEKIEKCQSGVIVWFSIRLLKLKF